MEELLGKILDRKYKLTRLIGEGGMGSVWEAEHTMISRRVAVKVMHAVEGEDHEILRRFFLEAQAASAIGHPNIIEIFDVGVEDDGTAFMVMELLNGVSLENLMLDRGALPPQRVVAIILQVLSALHAAHSKGIIHRDLKPDNIFLAVDSRMREDVKLLDFGVAKILAADSETLKLTKPGTVLGTPYYLSPEQARGGKDIDTRIDIWAIGVMMFEMLTGRLPFEGDNYNEVIGNILMNDAPPIRDLAPSISFELASVVVKAMAKDRDKRYLNVGEMIKAMMPLHDSAGGDMGPASAKAMRDSVAPPSPKGESTESVRTGAHGDPDKIDTLSPDLLQTMDGPEKAGSKTRLIAIATGVVVLAIAGIAFALLSGEEERASDDPSSDSQNQAGDRDATPVVGEGGEVVTGRAADTDTAKKPEDTAPEASGPDREAKPERVSIRVIGLVPKAKVYLDGKPVRIPAEVDASAEEMTLKITAPGYRPYTEKLLLSEDLEIRVKLKKVPVAGPGKKTGGKPIEKKGWKDNPFG